MNNYSAIGRVSMDSKVGNGVVNSISTKLDGLVKDSDLPF